MMIEEGTPNTPFPDSYWVAPAKFLAGEYPRTPEEDRSREKIGSLLECGIRCMINLTEEGESAGIGKPLLEYEYLIEKFGLPVKTSRYPIPDKGTISAVSIKMILDDIDRHIEKDIPVYLHCWGGHGRTGLVAGCWLARHGLGAGPDVLDILRFLRVGMPDGWKDSPETDAQKLIVTNWKPGE